MLPVTPQTGLTITNPLVLYRALIATKKIEPDPAQHRLALHLQKLYHRLKDYEPEADFSHRIQQISRITNLQRHGSRHNQGEAHKDVVANRRKGGFGSLLRGETEKSEATALTRRLTEPESAIQAQSPQGLLLYGEVGTGKSLLVDLLADCLPTRKKRRWHFNTFMLETFTKLERFRRNQAGMVDSETLPREYSLLWLARDLISTSPILFLDEFQLPDRAASKILSNLLTSFFHLGGVLIATSNRMPEELANAAGIEFAPPPPSKVGLFSGSWGRFRQSQLGKTSEGMFSGKGESAVFLDVLKARCEVWDMEGRRDWRRREAEEDKGSRKLVDASNDEEEISQSFHGFEDTATGNWGLGWEQSTSTEAKGDEAEKEEASQSKISRPARYFVRPSMEEGVEALAEMERDWKASESSLFHDSLDSGFSLNHAEIPWQIMILTVYARPLLVPRQCNGVTKWTFDELCGSNLGPADYITLASTFHTFVLTSVPVLKLLQKNEARRLITLLDALYESRCKLLVSAEAGPDDIFFPETRSRVDKDGTEGRLEDADGVYPETFAEIYQDRTSPFRPNISSYQDDSDSASTSPPPSPSSTPSSSSVSYASTASPPSYAPTTSSPFSSTRSILADEDSDFGPVLGRHAAAAPGRLPHGPSDGVPGAGNEIGHSSSSPTAAAGGRDGPDFSRTDAYTGEDERFAYKRARSRLWEMCGSRWWARQEEGWWRPLSVEARSWEGDRRGTTTTTTNIPDGGGGLDDNNKPGAPAERISTPAPFRHNASPFRTAPDPPPKFGLEHVWGMMRWGKKAGAWGKGVEGLGEKRAKKAGGDGDGDGGGDGAGKGR